jgi:predicted DCC family thiol-disulfide oxidoreductase YuxK
MKNVWHRLFLEERSSIGLSFFRIFVALTTGLHVLPSFVPLADNYLSTAFKTVNPAFFTTGVLDVVGKSPDWLVVVFVWAFVISWLFFLFGLFSQVSCIAMTACCYYFYALNDFHIGTLSWDILLVTLFLMCLTSYHGDYFSIDALRKGDAGAYRRPRPFFIQRLLQMQIASTFFYTALYKTTAEGNWFSGNPLYYLMNYPPSGVTKNFLLKEWMAVHPDFCYVTGILIIIAEFAMPFLLFIPRTRRSAIVLGFFFHILLILTLDVPAIFFFLFPAQLLLFINPVRTIEWVEAKRKVNGVSPKTKVVYDGDCGFCMNSVNALRVMDLFGKLDYVNFRTADLAALHSSLTYEKVESQLYIIESDGYLYGGFFAFRRLCWILPMMFPLLFLFYLPGAGLAGAWVYQWVADNRFLFHVKCLAGQCHRKS